MGRGGHATNTRNVCAAATGADAASGREVAEGLWALLRGETTRVVVEYPCHAPDQQRWFRMIATRPDATGDVGAVVTHVDITDVVRSERTLRDAERRMAAILDALGEGVCAVDGDGRVALLNPAARRLLGVSEGQGIGVPVDTVIRRFGADGAPVVECDPVANALRDGRSARVFDEYVERASGERFPVEYDVAPLRDATATVAGAVVTFVDAGPRREVEASLAAARRLEALGQLTGGVAHDFNNLLTVVGGNAELLVDTLPEGKPRRSAELIRIAVDRGAAVTQQLLAFGRRQPLDPQSIDLLAASAETLELLQHGVDASVTVELDVHADVWPIRVDPLRLEAALLNLVANSGDALPNGGVVRVAVQNATLDASRPAAAALVAPYGVAEVVAITVTDDGIGIRKADQSRVFEPFFTTKGQAERTGLGLSMVHGFAHQSGGAIDILSEPGVGTTVTIWLPRHVAGASGAGDAAQASPGAADAATLGATVLVVDDDPLVRAYASELLGRIGCVSVEVEGPAAALRLLAERDDVDIVFSDVIMPGPMDGDALAQAVRASWPWIKVVLTSGHGARWSVDDRAGDSWTLLPKPYGQRALADAIAGALPAAPLRGGAHDAR